MEFPQGGGGAFLKEMLEKLICIAYIFMKWFLCDLLVFLVIIHLTTYYINDPIHSIRFCLNQALVQGQLFVILFINE